MGDVDDTSMNCGKCRACCEGCEHMSRRRGCSIYAQRPDYCRFFNCVKALRQGYPLTAGVVKAARRKMRQMGVAV